MPTSSKQANVPAQPEMEPELDAVVRILVQNRWPWRLHATYDEAISQGPRWCSSA
jgi:predicted amidohydrolase YtcJ